MSLDSRASRRRRGLSPKINHIAENLPKFSGNNFVSTNEHLVEFSNAFHNIGDNNNDTCMRLLTIKKCQRIFSHKVLLKSYYYKN
jgi:hypothetical protein